MTRLPMFALSAALLFGATADATPELPGKPTAAFHLGQKALDVVTQIAMDKVPSHVSLPNVDKDLGVCGMAAHVSNASLDLDPHSLALNVGDGSLSMATSLDVAASAHVVVTNGYACVSTAECDVSFSATNLSASAAASLSVTAGRPQMSLGDVSATVPDGDLHIRFSNCVLDNLSGGLVDSMAHALLEMSQGLIQDKLQEIVPPLVESQMTAMLNQSGNVGGYGWAAKLDSLTMTTSGIDAYAELAVDWEGAAAECLPPGARSDGPKTVDVSSLELPAAPSSSIMVGITASLVSNAIAAAWQSGLLCMDDSILGALGFDTSAIVKLVPGLPAGMTMHFSVGIDSPPTLTVGNDGELVMNVKGAELLLVLQAQGQKPDGVVVATDFTVGVTPTIDPTSGGIFASLGQLSIQRLDVDAGASGTTYTLDPARLQTLLTDVVIPMAQARLAGMPISTASFAAPPSFGAVYTWIDSLNAHDHGIYLGLEAFVPSKTQDVQAPVTVLKGKPASTVRAGMVRFDVDGRDDLTPPQLIQYEWQLDGGSISTPSFARTISAPVMTAGAHTFSVRAVDLAGNRDPIWQTATFSLDPTPPTLTITEQPGSSVRGGSVTIGLTGSDDQTAPNLLSYGYRISRRSPGGTLTTVGGAEPTGLAGGAAAFTLDHLKQNDTYEVTVLLYDAAGNVTSQKVGFGVASTGCSMAGDSPSSLGALLLVGLALYLATRRRTA